MPLRTKRRHSQSVAPPPTSLIVRSLCVLVVAARRPHHVSAAAAIFGNFLGSKDETVIPPPPPPPPGGTISTRRIDRRTGVVVVPPPPPRHDDGAATLSHNTDNRTSVVSESEAHSRQTVRPPSHRQPPNLPPPPSMYWGSNSNPDPGGAWNYPSQWPMSNDPSYWNNDVPPPQWQQDLDLSMMQQRQQQEDWDVSMQRQQHDLIQQAQNLTEIIVALEQREELHLRQMDVLTERVVQVEAMLAQERNQLMEYQSNCSEMGFQIAALEGEVDEWRARCAEFVEQREKDEVEIIRLKRESQASALKVEDLAALIERHRLASDDSEYVSRKKKRRRGFFAWLFGWGSDDEESDLDEVYEEGRSTLLKALQTERSSVHELETAVASLQQNNTAISEQVKSRDLIIDELNDRIAVFEEDKLVLKAALKQLQKEMNDEAPKTQKLIDDLGAARTEVKKLQGEIESTLTVHRKEVLSLQKTIAAKEEKLAETQSNLTMIGTYVDRLESRLADFSVARRDVEEREKKSKEIEKTFAETKEERDALKAKVKELDKEHEDLKALLQELAAERSNLKSQEMKLKNALEHEKQEVGKLQSSLSQLTSENESLLQAKGELQTRLSDVEARSEAASSSTKELQDKLLFTTSVVDDLRLQVQKLESERQALVGKLGEEASQARVLKDEVSFLSASREALLKNLSRPQHRINGIEVHLTDLKPNITSLVHKVASTGKLEFAPPSTRSLGLTATGSRPLVQARLDTRPKLPGAKIGASPKQPQVGSASPKLPALASLLPKSVRPGLQRESQPPRPRKEPVVLPGPVFLPEQEQLLQRKPGTAWRPVRKFFARATGLHGFFTKDYRQTHPHKLALNQTTAPSPLTNRTIRLPTNRTALQPGEQINRTIANATAPNANASAVGQQPLSPRQQPPPRSLQQQQQQRQPPPPRTEAHPPLQHQPPPLPLDPRRSGTTAAGPSSASVPPGNPLPSAPLTAGNDNRTLSRSGPNPEARGPPPQQQQQQLLQQRRSPSPASPQRRTFGKPQP